MSDQKYFVRFRGRTLGPFNETRVRELIKRGQVTRMHELSPDGVSWQPADAMTDFFGPDHRQQTLQHAETRGTDAGNANQQPQAENAEWYANLNNEQKGPVTKQQLGQWVASGAITQETLVWQEGTEDWEPANVAISEFFFQVPSDPTPRLVAPPTNRAGNPSPPFENPEWYANLNNEHKGPVTRQQLGQWVASGAITQETLVWQEGTENWESANIAIPEFFRHAPTDPTPMIVAQPTQSVVNSSPTVARGSNLATTSIILSCIGLFCFGIILCPIACVLAIVAMNKGEKNALLALILSIVIFIPSIFLFIFVMSGGI